MLSSYLNGHAIIWHIDKWLYIDNLEPTAGNYRPCGNCGKERTKEGHDGCLGTLPGIRNACCGHGFVDEVYIQFQDGFCYRGKKALEIMRIATLSFNKLLSESEPVTKELLDRIKELVDE